MNIFPSVHIVTYVIVSSNDCEGVCRSVRIVRLKKSMRIVIAAAAMVNIVSVVPIVLFAFSRSFFPM